VEDILDQWWGEDATYFKVRADDDKLSASPRSLRNEAAREFYILKHKATGSLWTLDSLARRK
jgi:hypothetical protein